MNRPCGFSADGTTTTDVTEWGWFGTEIWHVGPTSGAAKYLQWFGDYWYT